MNFRDNSAHKRERPGRHESPMVFKAEHDGEAVSVKGRGWLLLGALRTMGLLFSPTVGGLEIQGAIYLPLAF